MTETSDLLRQHCKSLFKQALPHMPERFQNYFLFESIPADALSGSYDPFLVILSVLIAIMASYTALDLAERIFYAKGLGFWAWFISGSFSMGTGIWTMHFLGMVAFKLDIDIHYDITLTLLSMVFALLGSTLVFALLRRRKLSRVNLMLYGLVLGMGIAVMHYTGMEALKLEALILYQPDVFIISILIAVLTSYLAIKLAFRFGLAGEHGSSTLHKLTSGSIMGLAISGMHYTGMYAAVFIPQACSIGPDLIETEELAFMTAIVAILIIGITLAASMLRNLMSDRLEHMVEIRTNELNEVNRLLADEVVHRTEAERSLRLREEELINKFNFQHLIGQLLQLSHESAPLEVLLQRSLQLLIQNSLFGLLPKGAIFLYDGAHNNLKLIASSSMNEKERQQCAYVKMGECICGKAAKQRELVHVSEVDHHHDILPLSSDPHGHYCQPIMRSDQLVGVIALYIRPGEPFKEEMKGYLHSIADSLADLIQIKTYEKELLNAKEQAEAASRIKSTFLANMSHEIRTPLNGVMGLTQVLMETHKDEESQENLELIYHSANNLLLIINDILDFSKIESGKMQLAEAPFDTQNSFRNIIEPYAYQAEQKGITLRWSLSADLPHTLYGDVIKLGQVLTNLIGNAIKFTSKGGIEIRQSQTMENGKVLLHFEVVDTGIGIPKDLQEMIFNDFWQVDASYTRAYEGTGLGLAITKKLVELLGGTIWVESVVDKGSRFHFTCKMGRHEGAAPKQAEPEEELSLKGMRILVAEDNEPNQIVIRNLLAQEEASCRIAPDGEEALKILEEESFDLLLLDLQMPRLDGISVIQRIRMGKIESVPEEFPIVVFSANAYLDKQKEALAEGADDYLVKPIKARDLVNALWPWSPEAKRKHTR